MDHRCRRPRPLTDDGTKPVAITCHGTPSISFFEHDLFGKPVSAFTDHALAKTSGVIMIRRFIGIAAVVAAVALPVVAQAQGVPGGIERGSRDGERAAGPVGAVVGGVIGGVVGGVAGVLGVDERPRFRSYVVEQRRPSYQYREDVRIGAVLPDEGVTYYDVPQEYGVRDYRYTVVNGRTVLVDPRTHRIVEVVE
jgi:hypothetical protein